MKRVDPDIIISANGHWNVNLVGTKERTDKKIIADLFEHQKNGNQEEITKKIKEAKISVDRDVNNGDEKWWDNVLDVCGENIDMLSIHWYFHENKLKDLEPKLNELKKFVSKKMNAKQFKWALTEYNCNTNYDADRVAGLVEGIGKFLNFGFDVANFWPMRIGGMEQRSMFSLKKMEPQYPYQIFMLFSKEIRGNMVDCSSTKDIFAFASVSPIQTTIVLSGSQLKNETNITITIPDLKLKNKEVTAIRYSGFVSEKKLLHFNLTPLKYLIQKTILTSL